MEWQRILFCWWMSATELMRNRIAVILLFLIPTLFFLVIDLTTGERQLFFQLAAIPDQEYVEVLERDQGMVFMGLTSVGFLTAFLALTLLQRDMHANRRLVIAGYSTSELILAKLLLLFCIIILISLYVGLLLLIFFQPKNFLPMISGFALIGFIYSCFGLLVGALVRRELEGILCIVLLANIDVGWLQNPMFYDEAQAVEIIHSLPAFYPVQAAMIAAFTDYSITIPVIGSIGYGFVFLMLALVLYWQKMKINK